MPFNLVKFYNSHEKTTLESPQTLILIIFCHPITRNICIHIEGIPQKIIFSFEQNDKNVIKSMLGFRLKINIIVSALKDNISIFLFLEIYLFIPTLLITTRDHKPIIFFQIFNSCKREWYSPSVICTIFADLRRVSGRFFRKDILAIRI